MDQTRDDLPAIRTEREPDYVARHLEHAARYSCAEYRERVLPPEPLLLDDEVTP